MLDNLKITRVSDEHHTYVVNCNAEVIEELLHVEGTYEAQNVLGVIDGVEFDSEYGAFFAYIQDGPALDRLMDRIIAASPALVPDADVDADEPQPRIVEDAGIRVYGGFYTTYHLDWVGMTIQQVFDTLAEPWQLVKPNRKTVVYRYHSDEELSFDHMLVAGDSIEFFVTKALP